MRWARIALAVVLVIAASAVVGAVWTVRRSFPQHGALGDRAAARVGMTTNDTRWRGSGWRGSGWLAAGEFAVVLLLVVADMFRLVPLSKVPFLLALGWISLRLRGVGWRGVGFVAPARWAPALALGVVAGAAMSLLELLVTHPLLSRLLGQPPDLTDFEPLVGTTCSSPWCLSSSGLWRHSARSSCSVAT